MPGIYTFLLYVLENDREQIVREMLGKQREKLDMNVEMEVDSHSDMKTNL